MLASNGHRDGLPGHNSHGVQTAPVTGRSLHAGHGQNHPRRPSGQITALVVLQIRRPVTLPADPAFDTAPEHGRG